VVLGVVRGTWGFGENDFVAEGLIIMQRNPEFAEFENAYGIHFPDAVEWLPQGYGSNFRLAMDAQPSLITVTSAGIPAYLLNYMDPKLIEVLVAPNKAAQILGEVKKGDWTTLTATFPIVEHTGEVSSYGDWNNNGSTGANVNFPQRQSYHYQTITQWGERQLDMAAQAKIDWASRLNIASAMVLDKFQNNSYFFGIAGLQNYGILNDPSLPAAIAPGTKVANTPKWIFNGVVTATANEIYTDIQSLFSQLVSQSNSLIEASTPMVLVMDAQTSVGLTATNSFNVNVYDLLKKNFPSITFETAPQYNTTAGHVIQLIAKSLEGQDTGYCCFTEKMRAHAIVKDMSAFKQKKSQGTFGAIIFSPFAIAQMIGV
jgi:hypothetical protein